MTDLDELIAEGYKWLSDFGGGYQDYPGGPMRKYDGVDLIRNLTEVLVAVRAERAAVPDAATEELRADEMTANEAIGLVLKRPGMYGLVTVGEHRSVKAERDAAVAAIGRVAEEIEAVAGGITTSSEAAGYRNGLLRAAQIVRAALDGAPEPEVRWEYRGRLQSCGYVAEGYISAEHAMNGLKVELEDHPYLQMDDTAIVERARVREWLPVKGESK